MHILIVNWAKIEDGAVSGGGVNGYCQGLALEMVRRGHSVTSLSSGTKYEPGPRGEVGPCHIRERGRWSGVRLCEVVNSPVLAPSILQFKEPEPEAASPVLEAEFSTFLSQARPDVVHFNNIEGFSAGCISAARSSGAKVLYSLHNYHTVCPQVYLMQGHRRPCTAFDNGHACAGCIPAEDPRAERQRLALGTSRPTSPPQTPQLPAPPWETMDRPAWRPLLNIVEPEPPSSRTPNQYALRRAAMIASLNSCHRVLAVSDFVRRKFEAMGVSARVLRTVHIGTRLGDLAVRSPGPAVPVPRGVIRIAFMGYNNWYKGLPMLADSLELLTPEYLARIHLTVLALNLGLTEPLLRRLEPRLAGLRIREGYRQEELPGELAAIDLGVVPSVWWDNAPQTVMEFQSCGVPVIGAELGGIPDFVRDGVNGLLFRGNDRWDLARKLAAVVREPGVLAELRSRVHPPKSMAEHGLEMERMYGNPLS